ncbi:AroM family protein [Paenibacillus pinihumi]|uniref:AroM family protein n=1 Tax=Paenibacillus pinihumi TaxID=669462 RepID=UPI00040EF433|nr:AroM family protein [Paenibacillus pinihumi]
MLGLLTLGHSPRDDLKALFHTYVPEHVPILMEGGLDEFTEEQIQQLTLMHGTCPLHVVTRDGALIVQQESLLAPLSAKACKLADTGACLIVLLCAGDFPPILSPVPVLLPGRLLEGAVRSVAAGGRLGVIVPADSQHRVADRRWRLAGFEPVIMTASVSGGNHLLAGKLRSAGVRQVVLDCISFSSDLQQMLLRDLRIPVWLPSSLAAHAAAQMLVAH